MPTRPLPPYFDERSTDRELLTLSMKAAEGERINYERFGRLFVESMAGVVARDPVLRDLKLHPDGESGFYKYLK